MISENNWHRNDKPDIPEYVMNSMMHNGICRILRSEVFSGILRNDMDPGKPYTNSFGNGSKLPQSEWKPQ